MCHVHFLTSESSSCSPNLVAQYSEPGEVDSTRLTLSFVALRDITAGEELTHSYIDLGAPTALRRKELMGCYRWVFVFSSSLLFLIPGFSVAVPAALTLP